MNLWLSRGAAGTVLMALLATFLIAAPTAQAQANTPPTIQLAPPVTLEAPASVADLTPPVVADADPGDVLTISTDITGALPLNGTIVTWTVTDLAGASASTSQRVTVLDTVAPLVRVSGDVVVEAESAAGAVVSYPAPRATDLVDGVVRARCNAASGGTFELGETMVSCFASDLSGNEGVGQFSVMVEDTVAPLVRVSGDVVVEAESAAGAVVSYPAPRATDLVDGVVRARCNAASGGTFELGETMVSCFASDLSGNEGVGQFSVTVMPPAPPAPLTIADIADALREVDGLKRWQRNRVQLALTYLETAQLPDSEEADSLLALRDAVSRLAPINADDVRDLTLALLAHMRELATSELNDAVDAEGTRGDVRRAQRQLDRGDSRIDEGRLSGAAALFAKAWASANAAF